MIRTPEYVKMNWITNEDKIPKYYRCTLFIRSSNDFQLFRSVLVVNTASKICQALLRKGGLSVWDHQYQKRSKSGRHSRPRPSSLSPLSPSPASLLGRVFLAESHISHLWSARHVSRVWKALDPGCYTIVNVFFAPFRISAAARSSAISHAGQCRRKWAKILLDLHRRPLTTGERSLQQKRGQQRNTHPRRMYLGHSQ